MAKDMACTAGLPGPVLAFDLAVFFEFCRAMLLVLGSSGTLTDGVHCKAPIWWSSVFGGMFKVGLGL